MEARTTRNPTWSRDELILTLDFYFRYNGNPPAKTSAEIQALSDLLNKMSVGRDGVTDKFRNTNGVYMKIMNFRRFDPHYASKGAVGLSRGGKGEGELWNEYYARRDDLSLAAKAIAENVDKLPENDEAFEDQGIMEAEEGRILTRVHLSRERSRDLVSKKKTAALKSNGRLECEACGFDFFTVYGERGKGFVEVHHTKPLHTLKAGSKTRLDDLSILCANCHRMIHNKRPWLELSELKAMLKR